jgi:hypothetical protein
MRNHQFYAALRELRILPNLLRATQIASNRAGFANNRQSESEQIVVAKLS